MNWCASSVNKEKVCNEKLPVFAKISKACCVQRGQPRLFHVSSSFYCSVLYCYYWFVFWGLEGWLLNTKCSVTEIKLISFTTGRISFLAALQRTGLEAKLNKLIWKFALSIWEQGIFTKLYFIMENAFWRRYIFSFCKENVVLVCAEPARVLWVVAKVCYATSGVYLRVILCLWIFIFCINKHQNYW